MGKIKILRISTIPLSLNLFLKGFLREMSDEGFEAVAVSSSGKDLEEVRVREGVKTISVEMERNISPLKDLKSLFHLIAVFKKEKPQIIHSITPKAGLLSMMAGWICKVPFRIHTFTGLVFPTSKGLKRWILILTDRITCLCATHVIPEGEGVKNDLVINKITRKPLNVLGNGSIRGVDIEYFDPQLPEVRKQAEMIKRKEVFTFIFIGRLSSEKGIKELLGAFKSLNNEIPATRLLLIGWAEYDSKELKSYVSQTIAETNSIEFIGFQEDVRPWLLASQALVLPSYREGFPNSILEAGAMGIPSVATDINGANEIIKHGVNGLLLPPKDENALFEAMKTMVQNEALREKMAANARPMVAGRFNRKLVRKAMMDYYRNLKG